MATKNQNQTTKPKATEPDDDDNQRAVTDATNETALEVLRKRSIGKAQESIDKLLAEGQLELPANYSYVNALTRAWLMLVQAKVWDKDARREVGLLTKVSKGSVAQALTEMVCAGYDPSKRQCYFINYGGALACQPSYFGDMATLRRALPGAIVETAVVYEGDVFKYSMRPRRILVHEQELANINPDRMLAAYAVILHNGREIATSIMPMDRIKRSWKKSKTYQNPNVKDSTHDEFPDEMAMRTVARHVMKYHINQSDDSHIISAVRRMASVSLETEFDDEVATLANGPVVDVEAFEHAPDEDGVVASVPALEAVSDVNAPAPMPEPAGESEPQGSLVDADF